MGLTEVALCKIAARSRKKQANKSTSQNFAGFFFPAKHCDIIGQKSFLYVYFAFLQVFHGLLLLFLGGLMLLFLLACCSSWRVGLILFFFDSDSQVHRKCSARRAGSVMTV